MTISLERTLKDFRELFEKSEEFREEIRNKRFSIGNNNDDIGLKFRYNFDFAMALLLGGVKMEDNTNKIGNQEYRKIVGSGSTWPSMCGSALNPHNSIRYIPSELEQYLSKEENKDKTIGEIKRLLEKGEIEDKLVEKKDDGERSKHTFKNKNEIIAAIDFIVMKDFIFKGADSKMSKYTSFESTESKIINLINGGIKQVILTGAPGTGKTFTALKVVKELAIQQCDFESKGEEARVDEAYKKYIDFVQFHSSYDYTDFVEGLRPVNKDGEDGIGFDLRDGIFRKFCDKARLDKNKNYFFIIDEINRADLSKVFGELMYGLEEDYRDRPFSTQYSALRKDRGDIDYNFSIPKNLYIIGTMNDIDRSVETFDFALRRRFVWLEVNANEALTGSKGNDFRFNKENSSLYNMMVNKKNQIEGNLKLETHESYTENPEAFQNQIEDLAKSAFAINQTISKRETEFNLSEHFHLGHAYFGKIDMSKEYEEAKEELWNIRVEPILKEYVRGYEKGHIDSFIEECKGQFLSINGEN